ncbi:MAG: type II toxin-antitoxin system HicA family toxin [Xanthobacteraceae bacterium]|nr:type II toxin-antitoxin system HicA family toxin [Xanthobacteraceae bacterium]MBX9846420.1 type II toxin-antitoxin system HicA family toxin [Xanthobacteraceae bacterium]
MASDRLARMRQNPAGDWRIEDIAALCREHDIRCTAPTGGGSHYKVSHLSQRDILTIPNRRPVKPIYIRKLVRFVDAVTGK